MVDLFLMIKNSVILKILMEKQPCFTDGILTKQYSTTLKKNCYMVFSYVH